MGLGLVVGVAPLRSCPPPLRLLVWGWEMEDERFGGSRAPSARGARPKVPRVGAATTVADVGGLAAEMSQLRLRLGGPSQGHETLLFNLVSTSGLALLLHRTLSELVEELVDGCMSAERKELARMKAVLLNDEVLSNLALKLVEAERGREFGQELADHCGIRLMRMVEGYKVVDVEMKHLLQEGFDLRNEIE